ncbi:MAG: homocysteine S-methyltransferase family protein [Oscillospiraceae bacterium]|nr:homocysteine S-methyltransferase family protein [Oscillospiraceae bacterium]
MNGPILLDGAMGTQMIKRGVDPGRWPEAANVTAPDAIKAIHRSYIEAGSRIIYACSFGANSYKLRGCEYGTAELVKAALDNARAAAEGTDVRVALDVGPIGEMLEPYGELGEQKARELYTELAEAGKSADLAAIETMWDIEEAVIALEAIKSVSDMPVFVTMTFQAGGRTMCGCGVEEMAERLGAAGADAIGINCSLGPGEALPLMKRLAECTSLPMIAKPNAGMPDPKTGEYKLSPARFAELMLPVIELGTACVGGCCGTGPEYIEALAEAMG